MILRLGNFCWILHNCAWLEIQALVVNGALNDHDQLLVPILVLPLKRTFIILLFQSLSRLDTTLELQLIVWTIIDTRRSRLAHIRRLQLVLLAMLHLIQGSQIAKIDLCHLLPVPTGHLSKAVVVFLNVQGCIVDFLISRRLRRVLLIAFGI